MPVALRIITVLLFLLPQMAHAHLVSTRFGEFYGGLLHPFTALVHLVPWLALGLLGGLQATTTSRWALLAFPFAVGVGAALGSWLPPLPVVDIVNMISFVVLGALAAFALQLKHLLFLGLALLFGLSHGYANGADELYGSNRLLYIFGVATAAYVAVTLVTALAHSLANIPHWGRVAVRAAGSWVVAIGLVFAGFTFFVASGA